MNETKYLIQAVTTLPARVTIITKSFLSLSADRVDYIHYRQLFPKRSYMYMYGLNGHSSEVQTVSLQKAAII